MKQNKIKSIIFDLDGVLVDAREWHYEALNRALNLFGIEISRYDHLITFDGLPTQKKLQLLTIERGLPQSLHGFINEMKQVYTQEVCLLKCKPIFRIQRTLKFLKENNFTLAVCSNSVPKSVEFMLDKSDILNYFEFYLSNKDVAKPKPDPEIYTKAFKRLKLEPNQCLVIEDNINGIKAAEGAGAHVLEVKDSSEVTVENITSKINEVESL